MTDLTIIIPTRNRLWSLPQAVDSCRAPGLKTQIIVADDGSTDGTWEWLEQQPDVTRIRLGGWGKPFAVNKAFEKAEGEYLRFLDSDDWFPAGTLQEQVELARREKSDLVVTGITEVDDEGRILQQRPWMPCDDFVSQQLGEGDSSHYSAFTFRTDFVRDIPHRSNFPAPMFATRDDRCLMLEVALKAPQLSTAVASGLCHRHHGKDRLQRVSGLSAVAANLNLVLVYQHVLRLLDSRGELTDRRKAAAARVLGQTALWLADHHLLTSLAVLDATAALDPAVPGLLQAKAGRLARCLGLRNYLRVRSLRKTLLDLSASSRTQPATLHERWLR